MALSSVEQWILQKVVEAGSAGIVELDIASQLGLEPEEFDTHIDTLLRLGYIKLVRDNAVRRLRAYRPTAKATMRLGG